MAASIPQITQITELGALGLSQAIHQRQVSCQEVMRAYLDQIARFNPTFNAIVCLLDEDRLMAAAGLRDAELARGLSLGPMHGFPHAVKDLVDAAGLVTSRGSPLFRDCVAREDALLVERIKRAGAIVIGKTNVPEFGLGSQTYNPVYGVTRNAYDPSRTAGGSSGGAAVALALRMLPLADGSDTMGSLRNPAAFNNVVGMRPSFGRVPRAPSGDVFFRQLGTDGPMARSVADVALLLSVQSGFDARSPLSSVTDPAAFARIAPRAGRGVRLAWLGDCGGHLPLEEGILELCEAALGAFALQGCHVEPVTVPYAMDRLWECWLTLRHWSIAAELGDLYTDPARRAQLKPEVVWEIEGGLAVSGSDLARAAAARSQWYAALRTLFERFDFLLLPSAQVFPFAADVHWPRAIAGHPMDTYHRWMEVVIGATLAGLPALGLPIGFNDAGLPMGMQIIGPAQADREVLAIAALLEEATGWSARCAPPSMGSAPAG